MEKEKDKTKISNLTDYCLFCEPWLFNQEEQILLKSDSFYLFAGIGAIVEGYIIIAPYKCNDSEFPLSSFSDFSKELFDEVIFLRNIISEFYKDCYEYGHAGMHFEHGRTGACLHDLIHTKHCYHAHLCCFPVSYPIWQDIGSFRVKKIHDINELTLYANNSPYLFIENCLNNTKYKETIANLDPWESYIVFLENETDIKPQYLRRLLASRIGKEHLWDWATFPQWNLVNKLIYEFNDWLLSKKKWKVISDLDGSLRISFK